MIFRENRLLTDDSHEISYLIFYHEKAEKEEVICSRQQFQILPFFQK